MTATGTPGGTADPDPVDEFITFGSTKTGRGTRDAPSRRGWLVAVAIVLAAAMGFGGARLTDTAPEASSSSSQTVTAEPVQSTSASDSLADTISRTMDSIVSVRTVTEVSQLGSPFGSQVEGEGSGVVIASDGLILTNAHVVENATQIEVTTADGDHTMDATVVGSDADHDLALLRVDSEDLTAITIGSSEDLELGDPLIALGYPLGLGPTATQGIVSGLNRTIQVGDGAFDASELTGLLQTDAAINPGNSGGALIDSDGRLIGINTAAASASSAENIGFAVAIDEAVPIIESLSDDQ
jgi:S1-C subfamily serine protease